MQITVTKNDGSCTIYDDPDGENLQPVVDLLEEIESKLRVVPLRLPLSLSLPVSVAEAELDFNDVDVGKTDT